MIRRLLYCNKENNFQVKLVFPKTDESPSPSAVAVALHLRPYPPCLVTGIGQMTTVNAKEPTAGHIAPRCGSLLRPIGASPTHVSSPSVYTWSTLTYVPCTSNLFFMDNERITHRPDIHQLFLYLVPAPHSIGRPVIKLYKYKLKQTSSRYVFGITF